MKEARYGVYAVVKQYAQNGIVNASWYYRTTDYYSIYNKVMELSDNDHEISANAASWCELAAVGEIYEFREGEIEIGYD